MEILSSLVDKRTLSSDIRQERGVKDIRLGVVEGTDK